ncbi:MAG TPA: UDP-2,3-diacylglucosamine diphosphatase [Woeseiaceae bacterium]
MTTLFISDLHLNAGNPAIGEQFLDFLNGEAQDAAALYILGDLFESWVGDDDPDPYYASIKQALRRFTDGGVATFAMHGNRDFMLGARFAAETGISLLADPVIHTIAGSPVILSHGDALCTDDVAYQASRTMTRDPAWQAMMLEKTLQERLDFAAEARRQSRAYAMQVSEDIADVNQAAVESLMRELQTFTLLHGHTHRPAVHEFQVDGQAARRIVLGDWYEQGSVVRWDESGPVLSALPRG